MKTLPLTIASMLLVVACAGQQPAKSASGPASSEPMTSEPMTSEPTPYVPAPRTAEPATPTQSGEPLFATEACAAFTGNIHCDDCGLEDLSKLDNPQGRACLESAAKDGPSSTEQRGSDPGGAQAYRQKRAAEALSTLNERSQ